MSPDGRIPADAGVRERLRTDTATTFAVTAGAGSGKTSVLVDRVVALVDEGMAVDRIAAITFTEKAASELRDRVRGRLQEPDPDASEEVVARREAAAGDLENAQITTIHGFCRHLLATRPLEAGLVPGFGVLDGLQADLLLTTCIGETVEELRRGTDPGTGVLLRAGGALADLRSVVKDLRRFPDLAPADPPPEPDLEVVCDLVAEAVGRVTAHAGHVPEEDKLMAAAREAGRQLDAAHPRDAADRFDLLEGLPLTKGVGNKSNWAQADVDLAGLKEAWSDARDARDRALTAWREVRLAWLIDQARRVLDRYTGRKAALGAADFDDLLWSAHRLLDEDTEVAESLKRLWDAILVDESQDTDPVQVRIVLRLAEAPGTRAERWTDALPAPGRLFLVGDPNQSIYRFRRADLEVFEQTREQVTQAGEEALLGVNFRSLPGLVEVADRVFRPLFDPEETGTGFPPLVAHRSEVDAPDGPVVSLFDLDPYLGHEEKQPVDDVRRAEIRALAGWLVAERDRGRPVLDRQQGVWRPMRWGDVAILVRANTAVELFESELERHGIPSRLSGGKTFFARLEVTQTLAVLRAVADPGDAVAVVAALRSPTFGVSDEELVRAAAGDAPFTYLGEAAREGRIGHAFGILADLHREATARAPSEVLRELYARTRTLPLHALKPDGERRVANLLKILDLAEAFESAAAALGRDAVGAGSLSGLIAWLEEQRKAASEEESRLIDEEGDAVTLMTIHSAKGLEFPVVALLDREYSASFMDTAVPDRAGGRLHLKGGKLEPAAWEGWKETERTLQQQEGLRLLYVGFTRARDHVLFAARRAHPPDPDPSGAKVPFFAPLETGLRNAAAEEGGLVGWAEPADPPVVERLPHRLPYAIGVPDAPRRDAAARQRAQVLTAWRDQVRRGLAAHQVRPASGRVAAHGGGTPGLRRAQARLLGTRAHEALERVVREGLEADAAAAAVLRPSDPDAVRSGLAPLVRSGLRLLSEKSADGWEPVAAELPVMVPETGAPIDEGTILSGSVDLILRNPEGALIVVDYKTEDAEPEELRTRYRPQLEVYRDALLPEASGGVGMEIWDLRRARCVPFED